MPYRDFFDHKGIYLYFLNVFALLTNLALLEWLFFSLTSGIIYKTLLLVVRPRIALLFMFVWPFFLLRRSLLGYGNQPEIYIFPAIAYAIYYSISLIRRDGVVRHSQTFLLGVCSGWILMMKFNYVSIYAATGCILLWMLCRDKKWKDLCLTFVFGLAGVIAAVLPGILYLWKHGILSDFVDIYFFFNLEYADFSFHRLLRLFQCWSHSFMPNGLVRFFILFPWLVAFILFVKKERCDKGDKVIVIFILLLLLLNAPTWLGQRLFAYYFIPLSLLPLLAYAHIFKYAARFSIDLVSGIQRKYPFIRPAAYCSAILFVGIMVFSGVSSIRRGIESSRLFTQVPTLEKDATLCELLDRNDRRILVVGNMCFVYRFYNARPDCRYLYQCPISEARPVIWKEVLDEIQSKKTPLILVADKCWNVWYMIPDYFIDFMQENYRKIDSLYGTLFVYNAPEQSM